jgi:hypothetical protein
MTLQLLPCWARHAKPDLCLILVHPQTHFAKAIMNLHNSRPSTTMTSMHLARNLIWPTRPAYQPPHSIFSILLTM